MQAQLVGHQGLTQAMTNQPGQQADQGDQVLVKGNLGRGEAKFEADILAQAVDGGEAEACHHHPDCTGQRRVAARGGHGIRITEKSAADHNGNRLFCQGGSVASGLAGEEVALHQNF